MSILNNLLSQFKIYIANLKKQISQKKLPTRAMCSFGLVENKKAHAVERGLD